jgi:hypothetical protein
MAKTTTRFDVNIDSGRDGRIGKGGRRCESFADLGAAERSARALVRHARERKVSITRIVTGRNLYDRTTLAMVSADALGRIWTDAMTMEGLI